MDDIQIKPITVDMRKAGYTDLYKYVKDYAREHAGGRMATALLMIIQDHRSSKMSKTNITVVQGSVLASA